MGNSGIEDNKKYTSNAGDFDCHADAAMQCRAHCPMPDGAHLWLHVKPLDAAIGQVSKPHHLGSCHGRRICQNNTKH